MAQVRAYVYHDGVVFRVYPPVVILKEGDKFELVNTVDEDCTWSVPSGPFEGGKISVKVDKKSKSAAKVAGRGPAGTTYEVRFGLHKAMGNSDPVIIIDP